ncbi:conserved hypothetical protein [Ricinus communis]|uniref:Uncharacterized protein n=1 Tax=Ricinus communis TaxID=3988 RepID=B9RSI3_RICCO|nr:conserved hypothetical protein [Ricinus communis]
MEHDGLVEGTSTASPTKQNSLTVSREGSDYKETIEEESDDSDSSEESDMNDEEPQ